MVKDKSWNTTFCWLKHLRLNGKFVFQKIEKVVNYGVVYGTIKVQTDLT